MELKPGYKQTEVGVIPEDWSVSSLEVFTTSVTSGRSQHDKTLGAYPVYGSTGVIGYTETPAYEGDAILVARVGANAGRLNVVAGKYGVTDNTIVIRLYGDCSLQFIWRQLEAKNLNNLVFGSGQPLITGTQIKGLSISIPSTQEQQAIAEALSDADALIESLEQLLTKKRQIKQGSMQALLTGLTRLQRFEKHSEYKKTELGLVPSDWSVIPLSQVAQCLIGLTYSPRDVRSSGHLVLRSSNVQNGTLSYEDNVFVEMDLPSRVITKKGDILVCVRNGSRQLIGKCAMIDEFAAGSAFGAFMAVLRSQEGQFLFHLFQSSFMKRQISDGMGATINQITNKDMASYKIIWPALEVERNAIAGVLSEMDNEVITLETQLQKARLIKQGMMQELLTGRIRLV